MATLWSCAGCPNGESGFCRVIQENSEAKFPNEKPLWIRHVVIPAGRQFLFRRPAPPELLVLCEGWAFRFIQLPNGGRQILNFLLPGDLLSVGSVFNEDNHFAAEALTTIQVCKMQGEEVRKQLATNPAAVVALAKHCLIDLKMLDEKITILGRYSAEQWIAYLFLHLIARIKDRKVIRDESYSFPQRQRHIADALGLTPVHVSRTISAFRDQAIADLSNGVLKILNVQDLEQLGSIN
jgi:CRP-like cAMP-binding protein